MNLAERCWSAGPACEVGGNYKVMLVHALTVFRPCGAAKSVLGVQRSAVLALFSVTAKRVAATAG